VIRERGLDRGDREWPWNEAQLLVMPYLTFRLLTPLAVCVTQLEEQLHSAAEDSTVDEPPPPESKGFWD
jgi:hypothetical protein